MIPKTQILSIVVTLDSRDNGKFLAIKNVSEIAKKLDLYHEIVVVVNRYFNQSEINNLKNIASKIANLQIYLLKNVIDYKSATMVGLENSIGDWVLTVDAYQDSLDIIASMLETAFKNNSEVVVALDPKKTNDGICVRLIATLFNFCFKALHKYKLSEESSSLKLFSRSIVNHILQNDSPIIAIETIAAKSNIKKTIINQTLRNNCGLSLKERIHNRWIILIGINHMPLRLANLLSGFGALVAVAYSLYVIIINFIRNNVVAGWTTVSLMMSLMFLTMSTVLWLLSEYLVMLMDPYSRKSRHEIVERISSNIQARDNYINIELDKN